MRLALCSLLLSICENLRLKILCTLRLGANNSVISHKDLRALIQDVFLLPLPVVTPLTLFSGLGSARFQGQGNPAQLFAALTFWVIPFDRGHLGVYKKVRANESLLHVPMKDKRQPPAMPISTFA